MSRRWDTDERGRGVADARRSLPGINELAELAGKANWVAEDPDAHLLPHLKERLERNGMNLDEAVVQPDGVLWLRLSPSTSRLIDVELRRSIWSILAGAVELTTFVRETRSDRAVIFDVVTGVPPGGEFATHGHTIRIEVSQPA